MTAKPKVLYIVNSKALTGGIGTVVDYLAEGINRSGELQLDTLFTDSDYDTNADSYTTTLKPSGAYLGRKDLEKTEKLTQAKLEELIKKYDLVHVQGVPAYAVIKAVNAAKRTKGVKIVNTVHSSVKQEFMAHLEAAERNAIARPDNKKLQNKYRELKACKDGGMLNTPGIFIAKGEKYWASAIDRQSKMMSLSDSVQHMTDSYKDAVIKEYKAYVNAHKHTAIPHGVQKVARATERPQKKRLLFVGRFAKEKGIDEFVGALPRILEKHPDAEIRIVGGGKDERIADSYRQKTAGKIKAYFKDKPGFDTDELLSRVHFTGWISDKAKLQEQFKWTDYLVVPSKSESFCLVAAEALMHGRIPIITRTQAMDELYISKGIALGIEPEKRTEAGIAETINKILSRDGTKEVKELAKRGRKFAIENYSLESMLQMQVANYQKLLGVQKASGLDKYLNGITDKAREDKSFTTYGSNMALFATPSFRHRGVVVKKAINTPRAISNLEREISAMRHLQSIFTGNDKYKLPELIKYDLTDKVLVRQRLYGPTALEIIAEDKSQCDAVMEDMLNWITLMHKDSSDYEYQIKDTTAFKIFEADLQKDAHKFGDLQEFQEVKKLVKDWGEKKFSSQRGFLQGDLSPIHFYFEEDGVYNMDFDGTRKGPVEEDVASFISNAKYHIMNTTGDLEYANQVMRDFLGRYSAKKGINMENRLQFYVAYYEYLKARMLGKEQAAPQLQAIIKQLTSEKCEL